MTETVHSFHIPVMGTSFTIESPVKVARYGIASVISLVDDSLVEKMRRFYCKLVGVEYSPIRKCDNDARAHRITAYLNLMDEIVKDQFEKLKLSAFEIGTEITKYFELLPETSPLKQLYRRMLAIGDAIEKKRVQEELREKIERGAIDVNIMTKVDGVHYDEHGVPLPSEFSDALAAFRGYAKSKLASSIVFSAGFNARLYGYVEHFMDFHADESGSIKKKIAIKVNDFRSALTQGKFFAKKGLWVSEYRVESGLNCGGHAFGHGGNLMGPSLEEFRQKKDELISTLFGLYNKARAQKNKETFSEPHEVRITAQGGIGTVNEQNFLLKHYKVDATGWGTPFLLVPEATTTDKVTLERLCAARREDLYLSDVSPLGVPFNSLRTSSSEVARDERIREGLFGNTCSKGYLRSNTEFTDQPLCVASRSYQEKKLAQILGTNGGSAALRNTIKENLAQKICLCRDLAGAAILSHGLEEDEGFPTTAICPGPNLAYFSKVLTLQQMVDHIYGRANVITDRTRPNMFMIELDMYIDYLEREINEALPHANAQKIKYFNEFKTSLIEGVAYYEQLIPQLTDETPEYRKRMASDLEKCRGKLQGMIARFPEFFCPEIAWHMEVASSEGIARNRLSS